MTDTDKPRSQSYRLRDLGCHAASCLPETNPYCGWSERAAHRCLVWSSTDDFWRGYWPVVIEEDLERVSCVCAKWGHFEYILWTDNVDIVHICYIQCDLFDRCIFNYEIVPATMVNTFLFILQFSALEIWGLVVDFRYAWWQLISVCNSEGIIKIRRYLLKLWSDKKGSSFWLTV